MLEAAFPPKAPRLLRTPGCSGLDSSGPVNPDAGVLIPEQESRPHPLCHHV